MLMAATTEGLHVERDWTKNPSGRRPRDTALIYAENRLAPWAKWAKEHREALGLPTIALLYKAMRQKATPIRALRILMLTARGVATPSFGPMTVGEPPEAIAEVDFEVAQLPADLHEVLIADYFTYGPIEARCAATRWKKARYSQLLECAKYALFARLSVSTKTASF